MLDSRRIRNAALQRYVRRGDGSKINPAWLEKVRRILSALNIARSPGEPNVPGFGFHELTGPRKATYAVWVTRNWRITFKWDAQGPYDIDLEDYHGK